MPDPQLEIPAMGPILLRKPHPNMRLYNTVPQENVALANDGNAQYTAGIVMGGGSAVNGMIFNRGSPHDYDNWANITGDSSWSYVNMLGYFKKSETYTGIYPSDQRGYSGPITASVMDFAAGEKLFLDAGQSLGYSLGDPNGPQKVGFSRFDVSRKFGRRVSAFHGYIKPIMRSRDNLKIIMNTTVSYVIFSGNRAVGVQIVNSSGKSVLYASKEIVLSAGAFESPAILQRSGIGPKNVLQRANVTIRKELPVGLNLQNHVNLIFTVVINDTNQVFLKQRDLTPESLKLWQSTGKGPYSIWYGAAGQAFVESHLVKNSGFSGGWADVHIYSLNRPETFVLQNVTFGSGEVVTSVIIQYARPRSTGVLELNASDPNGSPVIDFRYLTHPLDMEAMLAGVKMTLELYEKTEPYQRVGAHVPQPPMEVCGQHEYRSDEYWKCFIRHRAMSGMHAAGTCKMGRESDPNAVVDSRLRVIGLKRLRVVDASIMPNVINSNFMAGLYGIAEKASEMILNEWR